MIALIAVLITAITFSTFFVFSSFGSSLFKQKYNVIFMVSDGTGPASFTAARNYYQKKYDLPIDFTFEIEKHLVGTSRTRSSNSFVTDSAAGATAFSCGIKTYNGAIGVSDDKLPCGTLMEAAKLDGYQTGVIVTSRVTHATPASFATHVTFRDYEEKIASQLVGDHPLGPVVDLIIGGGSCNFIPKEQDGSCRKDSINLFKKAKENGYIIAESVKEFQSIDQLPAIALFDKNHMDYSIDRDPKAQPTLREMLRKGLDLFSKDSKPFFLLVEGSRIDMAAHNNDPASHINDLLEYVDAFEEAKTFADKYPNTIIISVSDHETGGLTLSRQDGTNTPYYWNPEKLFNVSISTEKLATLIQAYKEVDKERFIKEMLSSRLNVKDPTVVEIEFIKNEKSFFPLVYFLGDMSSKRALVGWTTYGHTAVDVNVYAYGPGILPRGNIENTDLGKYLEGRLNFDLQKVTEYLRKSKFQKDEKPLIRTLHHRY